MSFTKGIDLLTHFNTHGLDIIFHVYMLKKTCLFVNDKYKKFPFQRVLSVLYSSKERRGEKEREREVERGRERER